MAQVVEGLLCKHKALSSRPNPTNINNNHKAIISGNQIKIYYRNEEIKDEINTFLHKPDTSC
jgi:hypothetical protein